MDALHDCHCVAYDSQANGAGELHVQKGYGGLMPGIKKDSARSRKRTVVVLSSVMSCLMSGSDVLLQGTTSSSLCVADHI